MSTRNISWGKGGRCVGLATLPPSCADCLEIREPEPSGNVRASRGMYRDCFTFIYVYNIYIHTHVILYFVESLGKRKVGSEKEVTKYSGKRLVLWEVDETALM
jgi:hypothetical protein